MSKMKTRICEKCRRAFQTRADYLSICDYCVTDRLRAREMQDPNSDYYYLKRMWKKLKKQWAKKKDRKSAIREFWSSQINLNVASNWKTYQQFNYYLGIPFSFQLTKKEFDSIKKGLLEQ